MVKNMIILYGNHLKCLGLLLVVFGFAISCLNCIEVFNYIKLTCFLVCMSSWFYCKWKSQQKGMLLAGDFVLLWFWMKLVLLSFYQSVSTTHPNEVFYHAIGAAPIRSIVKIPELEQLWCSCGNAVNILDR